MKNVILYFLLIGCLIWALGCDSGGDKASDSGCCAASGKDTGAAGDTDADGDTDGDADGDTDSDTDADGDSDAGVDGSLPYPIVDTGQTKCYNATVEMPCPAAGAAFGGQDAQHDGHQPSFTLSGDGLTVKDNVTGLTWQHTTDRNGDGTINAADKLTYEEALAWPATLNAAKYGGFDDWRLPTIKEAYSLILFRGTDPNGTDPNGQDPFIDTSVFDFGYGDTAAGERLIDAQYASTTLYVSGDWTGGDQMFGVNFADGRIKGYGLTMPGGLVKTFFVQCVRGNMRYGINDFVDNDDGTITDAATGLMWSKTDSGEGLNWEEALAWVQTKNTESYLGHDDWRLPNVKELQSILDYTRAPDTTSSAAIDPVFDATEITNEDNQTDYPWYWSSTTHAGYTGSPAAGAYVCFGRALGYMLNSWIDIHGAGAQRSDPKGGDFGPYTAQDNGYYNSRAPQGDAIRIDNYVRLVRDCSDATGGDARYPIVDTGQTKCYNATVEMPCPAAGAAFDGQDAQHQGHQPSFTLSNDGLTVKDNVTGLFWQQSPDTNHDGNLNKTDKLNFTQAKAYCDAMRTSTRSTHRARSTSRPPAAATRRCSGSTWPTGASRAMA